jgi:hypothetical protein
VALQTYLYAARPILVRGAGFAAEA